MCYFYVKLMLSCSPKQLVRISYICIVKNNLLQIVILLFIVMSPIAINGISDYLYHQEYNTLCCDQENQDRNEREEVEETEVEFFQEFYSSSSLLIVKDISHSIVDFDLIYRNEKVLLPPPEPC